jgi:hypothetical protein
MFLFVKVNMCWCCSDFFNFPPAVIHSLIGLLVLFNIFVQFPNGKFFLPHCSAVASAVNLNYKIY